MEVTLKIKEHLYQESEDGKSRKIIKRNAISYLNIETNDILTIGDLLNNKGNIVKSYCRLHLREIGPVIVNHSREYVSKLKIHKTNQIGFRQRKRRKSTK